MKGQQVFKLEKKKVVKSNRVLRNEKRLKKFFMGYCPDVEKIIFNNPVTIVILKDGKKGIVRVREGDRWSAEKGMLYAYVKAKKQKKVVDLGNGWYRINMTASDVDCTDEPASIALKYYD